VQAEVAKVELELVRALRGDDGLTPLLAAAKFGSGNSTKMCPAHRHDHLVAVAHFARSKRFAGRCSLYKRARPPHTAHVWTQCTVCPGRPLEPTESPPHRDRYTSL
jgi:hypothetical protein